jgi:hypothetical protein
MDPGGLLYRSRSFPGGLWLRASAFDMNWGSEILSPCASARGPFC